MKKILDIFENISLNLPIILIFRKMSTLLLVYLLFFTVSCSFIQKQTYSQSTTCSGPPLEITLQKSETCLPLSTNYTLFTCNNSKIQQKLSSDSFCRNCLSPLLIALGCGACLGATTNQPQQTVTVITTNPSPFQQTV